MQLQRYKSYISCIDRVCNPNAVRIACPTAEKLNNNSKTEIQKIVTRQTGPLCKKGTAEYAANILHLIGYTHCIEKPFY